MIPAMFAYAWTADKKTHIAGPVISLFACGMTQMIVYSSALAYVVDANPVSRVLVAESLLTIAGTKLYCIRLQLVQPRYNGVCRIPSSIANPTSHRGRWVVLVTGGYDCVVLLELCPCHVYVLRFIFTYLTLFQTKASNGENQSCSELLRKRPLKPGKGAHRLRPGPLSAPKLRRSRRRPCNNPSRTASTLRL